MWKSFVKVSFRNLWKDRIYSFINLIGLSTGLTASILIAIYINGELSYDRFFEDSSRIYRVGTTGSLGSQDFNEAVTPPPLAEAVQREFPGIELSFRATKPLIPITIDMNNQLLSEEKALCVDNEFLKIFKYPVLSGKIENSLDKPKNVVFTESAAYKYFGKTGILNEFVKIDKRLYQVAAVIKDPPVNSHLRFNLLLPISFNPKSKLDHWGVDGFYTYVKLKENVDSSVLEEKMVFLIDKYVSPMLEDNLGFSYDDLKDQGGFLKYDLTSIEKIHLYSNKDYELKPGNSINELITFTFIAIFILIIASVNFINLSTARSATRAKEVGVRKVLGSVKKDLIYQFLIESVIMCIVAGIVSIVLVFFALPSFGSILNKELNFLDEVSFLFLVMVFIGVVFLGILAGFYPAMYLTSFEPAKVLKGVIKNNVKTGGFRNTLVSTQFGISVGLIVCTILVFNQLQFSRNKDLGFDKDQVMVLKHGYKLNGNGDLLKQALKNNPKVIAASICKGVPSKMINTNVFKIEGSDTEYLFKSFSADEEYLNTLKLEIIAGRNFLPGMASEESSLILNETAVRELELTNEKMIGKGMSYADRKNCKVVGVVKDFNFESLRFKIKPLIISMFPEGSYVIVRLGPNFTNETINHVRNSWNKFTDEAPFEYSFLDDQFYQLMRSEQQTGKLFGIFTALSVVISCLGLFGLMAFMTERRAKEISVRKVLGGSPVRIAMLLTNSFAKPVLIGIVVAIPIAYYLMEQWLQNFEYRISLGILPFVATILLTLIIAILIVATQTLKVTREDPIKSLRSE